FYVHHLVLHSFPTRRSSDLAIHADNSHPMVHPVGDIQVPLGVYPAAVRTFQTGVRGGSAVAIASPVPTRDGGHDAGHSIDAADRSEEHTSELQSRGHLVCRL